MVTIYSLTRIFKADICLEEDEKQTRRTRVQGEFYITRLYYHHCIDYLYSSNYQLISLEVNTTHDRCHLSNQNNVWK